MAVLRIGIADLGAELRRLPKRDQAALRTGIKRTFEIDAHRWIQWSISGGGMTEHPAPTRPKKKEETATEKPKVPEKPKEQRPSKPKVKKMRRKRKDPCPPKAASTGYRQPVDTGDYANSWKSEMLEDGGIFYSASRPPILAGVIEKGRRPAPIPIRPLADWVRRKLGCADPKRAKSIAIAISRIAAETKRPGLKVLERAHPKIAEALEKNIARELKKVKPGT